jgi:hypothetical protein
VLSDIHKPTAGIVEPDLDRCLPLYECIQVAVAIQVVQLYALGPIITQALAAVRKDACAVVQPNAVRSQAPDKGIEVAIPVYVAKGDSSTVVVTGNRIAQLLTAVGQAAAAIVQPDGVKPI